MRKLEPTLFTLFFSISFFFIDAQQIPNGSFEEWEIPNTWTETPVGWTTQNGQLIQNTVRDSFPSSGDWAMRVYPISAELGEYGVASTTVPFDGFLSVLGFDAKWEKTSTAAVSVEVDFMNDELVQYTEIWSPQENSSDWSYFEISTIPAGDLFISHLRIKVTVSIGDFAAGEGWIAVDDIYLYAPSGVSEIYTNNIEISPNPCDEVLNLNTDQLSNIENMVIYDVSGHLIYTGKLESTYDTCTLTNGTYILQIGEGEEFLKERFQVLH